MDTISVSYQNQNYLWYCTRKHKNFGPECKTLVSASNSTFGSKAKMSQFAPNIFSTFNQFSGRLPYTIQHIKYLEGCFSILARYGPFWLWTWSKIENFEIFYKTKNDYLIKTNDSCFMVKVKILYFWPCPKSKWAISCQNGKRLWQIF